MNNSSSLAYCSEREVDDILKDIADEEHLSDYKVVKVPSTMKGEGYLSVISEIQISGKDGSNDRKVLDLVVKTASKSEALRSGVPVSSLFRREIYMYNAVIPVFYKFMESKGLRKSFKTAKCYKACSSEKSEALVLENLKLKGYSTCDRRIPMEGEHVELVMAEYGRFHAFSYALRDQDPKRFEELVQPIDDIFIEFMLLADFANTYKKQLLIAKNSLDPIADKEVLKVYGELSEEIEPFLLNLPKLVDGYSVVLHGDAWTNNMMFKYEDDDNVRKPTRMCMIDLQIARLGPPVLDLAYYIYCCCSKQIIDNLDHYLRIYYDNLSDRLRKLGSNPEVVYPYLVLRKQWKECAKYGLICAPILIHIMLSEQNEVADLTAVAESGKDIADAFDYNIASMEEYNDRIRHIIKHFVKNNFI